MACFWCDLLVFLSSFCPVILLEVDFLEGGLWAFPKTQDFPSVASKGQHLPCKSFGHIASQPGLFATRCAVAWGWSHLSVTPLCFCSPMKE